MKYNITDKGLVNLVSSWPEKTATWRLAKKYYIHHDFKPCFYARKFVAWGLCGSVYFKIKQFKECGNVIR